MMRCGTRFEKVLEVEIGRLEGQDAEEEDRVVACACKSRGVKQRY